MDEAIQQAAEEFGKALAEAAEVGEFQRAAEITQADGEALRLKAELESTYDDLIQRQSQGAVLSRGEIDAYYELEQRVRSHPHLAGQSAALEQLKDVLSEAHNRLSSELGLNFKDLID